MIMLKHLDLSPEVQSALAAGRPVVALESTIIAHGMPFPQNVETARRVEDIIRAGGAVPATCAVINGRLKAGLTEEEMLHLGQADSVIKASRRDLPYLVAHGLDGATTVASTMIIAALAGIQVFVTGGIGGVHRGAMETFDISADLTELAQTNVIVVCAGCKSILDIGLTLEYLETQGVPVLGYQTPDFPAFYTRKSGFAVDYMAESALAVAKTAQTKWELGLQGGIVLANPIPTAFAMDEELIGQAIDKALREAEARGIRGKDATPFLLSQVTEVTGGQSLAANMELIYNNAALGAQVAVELAALRLPQQKEPSPMPEVEAYIEIPKGSTNKYEFDTERNMFFLDRALFSPMHYPAEYGFIPETLADDGDPMDIMVLMMNPTFPGCAIRARVIGMFLMEDDKGNDVKVISVPVNDPRFTEITQIAHMGSHLKKEFEHFFSQYKQLEGKTVTVHGWADREEALAEIERSRATYAARQLTK